MNIARYTARTPVLKARKPFKLGISPISVCEVTTKFISKVVRWCGDSAYLVMSREAFSPTFMVVTPSSQPAEYQLIVRTVRCSSRIYL